MKKKVLICGATGFIGRNLIEYFQNCLDEYEVWGTYHRQAPPETEPFKRQCRWVEADLTVAEDVTKVIQGKDVVIQAAATTSGANEIIHKPYHHVRDNAVMNSLIFRACHDFEIKQVVFFSCTIMYPQGTKPAREDDFTGEIIDKYFGAGWTKVYAEKMCEFYSRLGKTKYTVIRHSNIYGPHDKFDLERSHVFGATIAKVMAAPEGGRIVVWGDGRDERDFLYVDDLTEFVVNILQLQTKPFELVNLGCGCSVSVRDLAEKIIQISGRKMSIEFDESKPSIGFKLVINVERVKRLYQWTARVPLEEGIEKTIRWYRSYVCPTIPRTN